jgi:hypothetical protein
MTSKENRKTNDTEAEPTGATVRPTFMQALRDAFSHWWGTGPVDAG